LLITVFFVEKINTDRGTLSDLPGLRPILRFNPLSVCLNKHQIEIRVLRLISKVLIVFKQVNLDLLTINSKVMEFTYFIGTDVSKNELDFAVMHGKTLLFHKEIANTETEVIAIKDTIIAESRKLDAKQNEYNLTKSMVDNLEGFPESIRFLKKNTDWSKNAPLFSDILFCREEYRVAVENYLEPLMNHYVVDTYNEAIKAINLLSKAAQGRAQFFVLNSYDEQAPPKSSPVGRTLKKFY